MLFSPITLRATTIRNRVWVAPMCQFSATDGVPNDWHLVHLGSFATGGAGLVLAEATAVAPEGRIAPEDTGLWSDEQRDAWRRITAFVRSQGAVPGVQLAHAGRKASTWRPWAETRGSVSPEHGGWGTVAPSALAFDSLATPRALRIEELPGVVAAFASAARRAVEAGFGVVEVHSAHGYLLHQFLSPLSNERDDAYGGSLERRARLLLEVVRAVRAEIGDGIPLLVRLSATDWVEDGWDLDQTTAITPWLREAGVDLIDVSSGGLDPRQRITLSPGYQVPFAAHVRAATGVPVAAVGLITEPAQAEEIVASGQADAVLLGRQLLREPRWPLRAAHELGVETAWPPQYLRARP